MAYYPRIHEEVQQLARELGELLTPAAYQALSPATGLIQYTQWDNNAGLGPFIVCGLRMSVANTPTLQLMRDGVALVQGAEDAAAGKKSVGVQSNISLASANTNGGEGDVLPAPIAVRGRLNFTGMRAAGGATTDKFLLMGFHASERMASEVSARGEAMWGVLSMPASGTATPLSPHQWCRFDHLCVRSTTPTAGRFKLRFAATELWPLGLTQLAQLPTTINGDAGGDVGIAVAPNTRVVFQATNPSAAAVIELQGRSWYSGGRP